MTMRSWSLSAGQWLGINVRVHLSFLFLLVFVWLTQSGGIDPKITLLRSLAFTLIVLVSVIVHEGGHLLFGRGNWPRALVLLPIGGLAVADVSDGASPEIREAAAQKSIRAAAAGPVASVLLAGLAFLVYLVWGTPSSVLHPPLLHILNLPRSAVWINLILAGLNLLPAYPLDGGRVLRSVLLARMDFVTATRRAAGIGNLFVVLLMFTGLWDPWFMLGGFFLFVAAQLEERTVLFQSVLENVRMEEVMLTEFATLSPADTLEDALSKAVHTLQDDFPVVRGTDMVGVISRQKILQALRGEGNAYVQSIMNRAYEVAGKQDSLASAFRKITLHGLTIIPVVDEERLVGIVTLQNLMHSMSVLAASRKLRRTREEESL